MGPDEVFELGFDLEEIGAKVMEGGTITSVEGVVAGACSGGIRRSRKPDVAIVAVEDVLKGATGAGVFTSNKAKAAPVMVSTRVLDSGVAPTGIVANSGCANALTGLRGLKDAEAMQQAAASAIGADKASVLVASTGLIGTYLPIDSVTAAISSMDLSDSWSAGHLAAEAIMTTDTFPKECALSVDVGDETFRVGAIAKGAAMLDPAMATMLAFVATDASVEREALQRLLRNSVAKTFNRMTVDACMSTNDCVLALATGKVRFGERDSHASRGKIADRPNREVSRSEGIGNETSILFSDDPSKAGTIEDLFYTRLQQAFDYVCAYLALAMAKDGEGSNKIAVLRVKGAASEADAERVARGVAASTLVRCSLYGGDPYWGRIVSEAGSAASFFDPSSVSVSYGPFEVCKQGVATSLWTSDDDLAEYMASDEIEIFLDLGQGPFGAVRVMAALGPGYIEENMRTS